METPIKAKDSPWYADLAGSVASTVTTNIRKIDGFVVLSITKVLFRYLKLAQFHGFFLIGAATWHLQGIPLNRVLLP